MLEANRIKSDLRVALGFSRANAEITMQEYFVGGLKPEERACIEYLQKRDPFRQGQEGMPTFPDRYIDTMNKLNLRLSEGK